MARPAGAWVPDGRAKAIRADCEASLAALDGLADRPLPPARTRSEDAVADVPPRARPPRGGGDGPSRRRGERQPAPARGGARPRADNGGASPSEPVRRPCAARRPPRALRRGGRCAHRSLAAGRPAPGRAPPAAARARRGRSGARRHRRRGRARLAPRPLAVARRHPGREAAGDGALGCARRRPRPVARGGGRRCGAPSAVRGPVRARPGGAAATERSSS